MGVETILQGARRDGAMVRDNRGLLDGCLTVKGRSDNSLVGEGESRRRNSPPTRGNSYTWLKGSANRGQRALETLEKIDLRGQPERKGPEKGWSQQTTTILPVL